MNPFYVGLLLALIGSIRALVVYVRREKNGSDEKYQKILAEFHDQVNNMLEEGETLEAYCGYNPYAAVTNRRLLIGDEEGIRTIPFSQIQKGKGMNYSGFKTKDPECMETFEIKADKKYVLRNQSDGFAHVVESLYDHLPIL